MAARKLAVIFLSLFINKDLNSILCNNGGDFNFKNLTAYVSIFTLVPF